MRYEIKTLGENWGVRIATIHLNGEFGFNDGSAFWNTCEPENQQCQVYYFDLSEVSVIRPDGLTWLRVFLLWARESGRSVRFINTPVALCQHLATAGIHVEGTATEQTALPATGARASENPAARRQDLAETLRSAEAPGTLRCG